VLILNKNAMANTYTQIHIHSIFAVQNRQSLIRPAWEIELYKYITGIVQFQGHKLLQINGMPDHVHLLIGMRPVQSLSELIQQIKQDSSKWINSNRLADGRFSWQEGFGAFSHPKSQVNKVIAYIQNQKEHHKKKSFREEYLEFLEKWEVDYDERYIFKPIE
jgi:REP element-mobilizing transposase RayT